MAVKVHLAVLLTVLFIAICLKQIRACDLVPNNNGDCLELAASPFLTYATTEFGPTIEGASTNPAGDMFAVNYGNAQTAYQLGQITPAQRLFYRDTNQGSFFNGIRFLNSETAFIADTMNHRILQLNVGSGNVVTSNSNYCSHVNMIQPNDLTLSRTGTVFTSGMNWVDDTDDTDGDIWSCLPDGTVKSLEVLGRTNGIDLSPDERTLYVSESYNRGGLPYVQKIWKYDADVSQGTIANKELFVDFEELDNTALYDVDGMKTDILGNLFVSRYGAQQVAIFSAQGNLIGKIALNFPNPTNMEFGGQNGTTLYIVGQCAQEGRGCVDRIEVVTPGRSWSNLQASSAQSVLQNIYSRTLLLISCVLYLTHKV